MYQLPGPHIAATRLTNSFSILTSMYFEGIINSLPRNPAQ